MNIPIIYQHQNNGQRGITLTQFKTVVRMTIIYLKYMYSSIASNLYASCQIRKKKGEQKEIMLFNSKDM